MKNDRCDKLSMKKYESVSCLLDDFIKSVYSTPCDIWDIVSIYADSETIGKLLVLLIREYGLTIGTIHLDCDHFDEDYQLPYSLSVVDNGIIMVERAYNDSGKPYHINKTAYMLSSDCGKDLINRALSDRANVILFTFCSDEKDMDESFFYLNEVAEKADSNDRICGFCVSKECEDNIQNFFYYTSKGLEKESVIKFLKEFGVK